MIRRIGYRFAALFRAITPDPFVLAVLLTLVVFALAAAIQHKGPLEIIAAWQGDSGFWSLLGFAMQMVLILVTGHALASSPIVARAIRRVARLPQSGAQAAALVSAAAIATALVNWGLGLVVGALLAREVGRSSVERQVRAHYPLLAAAGYTGLMCWHGGLSGTAPLMMTNEADMKRFLGADLAAQIAPTPFTRTVLSPANLLVSGGLLLLIPLLCAALAPRGSDPVETIETFSTGAQDSPEPAPPETRMEKFESSRWLTALLVIPLLAAIVRWFRTTGIERLEPNALNLMFLTAGLILHGTVPRYLRAVNEAVKGAAGIVLQFPFYAGIMGVMRATGLATTFAAQMTAVASPKLYAVLTFFAACVINLFVPSGGGQWAVQGPIAVAASTQLGVPIELSTMSVAYGDQLTNMLQPFWALPLLAITGVRARDIIGYTAVLMIAGAVWIIACLLWLAP